MNKPQKPKVKQSKTGSWYVTVKSITYRYGRPPTWVYLPGGLLGYNGRPTWFATTEAAQTAADQWAVDHGKWQLIEPKPKPPLKVGADGYPYVWEAPTVLASRKIQQERDRQEQEAADAELKKLEAAMAAVQTADQDGATQ
jgi:hypothetical protein